MTAIERLDDLITRALAPIAQRTDAEARFPREMITAMGEAGLLGLVSSTSVGGLGLGLAEASAAVSRVAETCPSTAMVLCMHYCAAHLLEQLGPTDVREAIAAGRHLTTLAFSEAESRSHFWAPVSTARAEGDEVVLDARKSWVTAAFEADSYVWSSRPLVGDGGTTLWLVDSRLPGLTQPGTFDGVGLRGNASTPITAAGVRIPATNRLGVDGKGGEVTMGVVLPWFSVLSASCSTGLMDGALARAVGHVVATRHQHLGTSLADLPTLRAYLARARIQADSVRALLGDTITAIGTGREDALLRVLEVKAAAAEAALTVTDVAMRVCGGAAFRKEAGIERLFRDARASSVMAPTSDVLYDFIGRVVTGLPLF